MQQEHLWNAWRRRAFTGEDERAQGRRDHRVEVSDDGYKEKFRVGNGKVEREWERDGDYREERECDDD